MKTLWKIVKTAVIAFVAAAIIFVIIAPSLTGPKWPRGNRQAILECRNYLFVASRSKTNSPNFDFSNLSAANKYVYEVRLQPYFNFLAKTNFVWGNSTNREIVILSQKQFDNVHKPGFWNYFWPNPAYAVGYSDGTAGIISPEEFTNLNLSAFVTLSSLATNSEFKISKP
jgi:hypothetical protein